MKNTFKFQIAILSLNFLAAGLATPANAQVFPIATNPAVIEFAGGVAFDGTNYMVGFVSGTNIVGQWVSTNGTLIGSPLQIGSNPGFPPAAAMANARTNCLVAWSDYSIASGVTMLGRICSLGTGTVGPVFPLLASAGTHGFQTVQAAASDGTNFLVVWQAFNTEVSYGQRVTAAGTLVGSPFALMTNARDIALAFGKTNYLVAWQSGANRTNHTYGRLISLAGVAGGTFQISATHSMDRNPVAIGFDGTNYLVIWNRSSSQNPGGWPNWNLYGRLVSQTGTPLGGELALVTEQAAFPAVAFDGHNYLLLWGYNVGTTNAGVTIRAQFLDRSANPIGPIFTPFEPRGTNPPLLPINGAFFDGSRYVLAATYGSFILSPDGDIVGIAGGDVYGRFLPRSTTPPVFTNAAVVNGYFQGQLRVVPGVTYTLEISTNLTTWLPAGVIHSDGTNLLHMVDDQPATARSRLFVRAAASDTGSPVFTFHVAEFANAGSFGSGFTPSPSYPVTLQSYRAVFGVAQDINFPPATNVYFTGPAGSGLTNTPASSSFGGENWRMYPSPSVFNPSAAPGGTWIVNYKGSNVTFNIPDPQAASRLVIPLPTVTVSGGVLQNVSWVYRNAITGAPLSGAPAYVTNIQVQIEDTVGGRIYASPELAPGVTSHTLTSAVNWTTVASMHMAYNDTQGNHYVVSFSRP